MVFIPPIHRVLQVLRAKYELKQFECAAALGISTSHLSNIEYGRQQPPEDFLNQLSDFMGLSPRDRARLSDAMVRAQTTFKIDGVRDELREDVAVLLSTIPSLPKEKIDELKRTLSIPDIDHFDLSSRASQNVDKLTGRLRTQLAAPLSFMDITAKATALRAEIVGRDNRPFDFMSFFEHKLPRVLKGLTFSIRSKKVMGNCSGATIPAVKHIALRQDIYDYASAGGVGSQYVIAHEIGHAALHEFVSPRLQENASNYPRYYHAEWQANKFAQSLLIPPALILPWDTPETLSGRLQVSARVAEIQLNDCRRTGLVGGARR